MNKIFCPNCYGDYDCPPEHCVCGYPFNGSEMEKHTFMSEQIKKKVTLTEGIEAARYSRIILLVIGGFNLLFTLINTYTGNNDLANTLILAYSIILISLGLYSYKEPFVALLTGFLLMIVIYAMAWYYNSASLYANLFLKLGFIGGFIYGLVKIKQAENIELE